MKLPPFWQHLPDEIKLRFGQKRSGRQRAMTTNGHLLLVLHKAPNADQRERVSVFFWRNPAGFWDSSRGGGLLQLEAHLEEYNAAEAQLSAAYEQAHTAEDYFAILEKVAPLQHSAKSLHATLQAAREAAPQDRDLIDLRDGAYEIERTLDLLYLDTRHALDFHIAKQTEAETRLSRQSVEIANRLNILAAIFFPLTALTGLFSMNLQRGFEQEPIFWAVLCAGLLLGVGLSLWVMRGALTPRKEKK